MPARLPGLLALRDWLKAAGCTHVGMESTGVYWQPVYAILEDQFDVVVGNAQRIKNVPERKTDVKDAEWIAELVRYGLIPPSFVPARPLRVLRDPAARPCCAIADRWSRRAATANRVLKVLESANIKLASVASDVFGVSGRAMLEALVAGPKTPAEIANLARGKLRKKLVQLELALQGSLGEEHRFMLAQLLDALDQEDRRITATERLIGHKLEPYRQQHRLLTTIPGIDWALAATMIAEHGVDMTRFSTAGRFAAWSGVAPGNNESAGKHHRSGARKGNPHLKTALYTAAVCAARTKDTLLARQIPSLKARGGPGRAAGAVAHKIAIAAFHILTTSQPYRDLGGDYLDKRCEHRTKQRLIRRLERMGYHVALQPTAG